MKYTRYIYLLILLLAGQALYAQPAALPPYQPTRSEEMARYKQTLLLDSIMSKGTVFKPGIRPNWQQGGNICWYRNLLYDSVQEYIYVNVKQARRQLAFDHTRLAQALQKASGQPVDPARLNITSLRFTEDNKLVLVERAGVCWLCRLDNYQCIQNASFPTDTTHYTGLYHTPSR